jgi:glycosyltransferase involved in cell wall biosynthesis
MRVLHVIDSLIQAGAEALAKDMIPRMRAAGLDVSVAVLKHLDSPFERELRDRGIPFLPTAQGGIYSSGHILSLARQISKFDMVQVYLFPAQLFTPLAAALARAKTPLVLAEGSTHHRRKKSWLRPLENWTYSRYAAIACASDAIAASLRSWVPAADGKIVVIPNGIDVQVFERAASVPRESLGINNWTYLLLYIARLEPSKEHGTLIDALTQIPNAELILVGDGILRGQLEAQARSLGVAERVHFLGRRSDIAALLKTADIYVHPSANEGFGIAAAEAMAAGRPVVAANVPGLAQVVGDAGVLVPPRDPVRLAGEILRLIDSPERRAQLSQAAAERGRQFSIEKTVAAYIDLYRSVVSH